MRSDFSFQNPVKCHEGFSLQSTIPPKRFDIFPPVGGGCSEGLDAFTFFFKKVGGYSMERVWYDASREPSDTPPG